MPHHQRPQQAQQQGSRQRSGVRLRRVDRRAVSAVSAGALLLASAGAASAATAPAPRTVPAVVASGEGAHAADALSAGPLAAALDTGVLLTTAGDLPRATADRLARRGATLVYVVGGPAAVSQHVLDQIAAAVPGAAPSVVRLDGADRYATAARVTEAAEQFSEAPLEP